MFKKSIIYLNIIIYLWSNIAYPEVISNNTLSPSTNLPVLYKDAAVDLIALDVLQTLASEDFPDIKVFYEQGIEKDLRNKAGDVRCFGMRDMSGSKGKWAFYVINLESEELIRYTTHSDVNDRFFDVLTTNEPLLLKERGIYMPNGKEYIKEAYRITDNVKPFLELCSQRLYSYPVNHGFIIKEGYYLSGLRNLKIKAYVTDLMAFCFGQFGISREEVERMVEIIAGSHSFEEAKTALYEAGFKWGEPGNRYNEIYSQYKKNIAPVVKYNTLKQYIRGKGFGKNAVVIDIGCGDHAIAKRMISEMRKEGIDEDLIPTAIGVDFPEDPKIEDPHGKIKYVQVNSPGKVPVEGEAVADKILIISALHHMPMDVIQPILSEAKRLLKPGGELIIFEDVVLEGQTPVFDEEGLATGKVQELSEEERRIAFTIFDWHANCVVADNSYVPMPGNYFKESKWHEVFENAGFYVDYSKYIGVYRQKFSNMPHAVFILKKGKTVHTGDSGDTQVYDVVGEKIEIRARDGLQKSSYHADFFVDTLPELIEGFGQQIQTTCEVGTGRGTVAIALGVLSPDTRVIALDINPEAVELTQENAERNGISNRFEARCGNLLEPVKGEKFDVIISTLPSQPLSEEKEKELAGHRDYELEMLSGGRDGAEFISRFIEQATHALKPNGEIWFVMSDFINVDDKIENKMREMDLSFEIIATKRKYLDETKFTLGNKPYIESLGYRFYKDEEGREYFNLVIVRGRLVSFNMSLAEHIDNFKSSGALAEDETDAISRAKRLIIEGRRKKDKQHGVYVVAIDGNSGALKSTTATRLENIIKSLGYKAVVIRRDWFIDSRDERYKRQDDELKGGGYGLKDDEISLRRDKFEEEVLRALERFNQSGEERMILNLTELYNDKGGGLDYPPENITIDRETVVIVEGNYLLQKKWRGCFDLGILMLARPLIGIQRRLLRDSHPNKERIKRIFWRINTPSFLHYLKTQDIRPDLVIVTDSWQKRFTEFYEVEINNAGLILRGESKMLFAELKKQKTTITDLRSNIDRQVITGQLKRILESKKDEISDEETMQKIHQAISDLETFDIKEFSAIVLGESSSPIPLRPTIRGTHVKHGSGAPGERVRVMGRQWLLGFNSLALPIAENLEKFFPNPTLGYVREALDNLSGDALLEYLLHEALCRYTGNYEARRIQEILFSDTNYRDAKGEPGRKEGVVNRVLTGIIRGSSKFEGVIRDLINEFRMFVEEYGWNMKIPERYAFGNIEGEDKLFLREDGTIVFDLRKINDVDELYEMTLNILNVLFWGQLIDIWDHVPVESLTSRDEYLEAITNPVFINKGIVTGVEKVLDLGTGPGDMAIALAERFPELRIIGVDISDRLLDIARRRAETKKLGVNFFRGNGTKLSFNDDEFDAVFLTSVLKGMPRLLRKKVLKEVFRVMKPGGRLSIYDVVLIPEFDPSIGAVPSTTLGWYPWEWEQILMDIGFESIECNLDGYVYVQKPNQRPHPIRKKRGSVLLKGEDSLREKFLKGELTTGQFMREVMRRYSRNGLSVPGDVACPVTEYRFGNLFVRDFKGDSETDNLIVRRKKNDFALLERAVRDEGVRKKFAEAIEMFLALPEIRDWSSYEVLEIDLAIIRIAAQGDPDREAKEKMRTVAFKILDKAITLVQSGNDPIEAALRISVIGNSLDLGDPGVRDAILGDEYFLAKKFDEEFRWEKDDITEFKRKVSSSKNIVYVFDNAGEDVLDFILINELLKQGHTVTLAGKSLPAANDTTADDLHNLINDPRIRNLLGENINRIRIISTGTVMQGTDLARVSEEFRQVCGAVDLIIFKGQGNYSTVRNYRPTKDCLFALRVKWPPETRDLEGDERYKKDDNVVEFVNAYREPEEGLFSVTFDVTGRKVKNISTAVKKRVEKSSLYNQEYIEKALDTLVAEYEGSGILSGIKEIEIVDKDGSFVSRVDSKARIGIDTFRDKNLVIEDIEHEALREILGLIIPDNPILAEVVAKWYSVRRFLKLGEEERQRILKELGPNDRYTEFLKHISSSRLEGDDLIRAVIDYVKADFDVAVVKSADVNLEQAVKLFNELEEAGRLVGEVRETERRMINVIKTFNGIRIEGRIPSNIRRLIGLIARHDKWTMPEGTKVSGIKYVVYSKKKMGSDLEVVMDDIKKKYGDNIRFVDKYPEGVNKDDVIVLVDPEDAKDWKGQKGRDLFYLPLPYMRLSLYLAVEAVLTGRENFKSTFAYSFVKEFYRDLLNAKEITDDEIRKIFYEPWDISSRIILDELNILRDAVSQLDKFA